MYVPYRNLSYHPTYGEIGSGYTGGIADFSPRWSVVCLIELLHRVGDPNPATEKAQIDVQTWNQSQVI